MKECAVDGCDRPVDSRGLCNSHAQRARRGRTGLRPDVPIGELNALKWYCECGDLGDTAGGFGSCSRCGRKSAAEIAREAVMFAERRA